MRVLFRAMGDSISHDGLATENDLPHADLAVLLPQTLRSSSVVARSRPTSTNINTMVRDIDRLERTLSSRTALSALALHVRNSVQCSLPELSDP